VTRAWQASSVRWVLAIAVLAVAGLLLPASAPASCVPPRPAPWLADADAAFIGRLVDVWPDRWVFAVDEAVKGPLGSQVELPRPQPPAAVTSVDLMPELGRRIGLLLQGDAATGWRSNACLQLTPAELRAAKADPNLRCRLPVIDSVRFRVPGRVDVALRRLDDPVTTVRVDWGDGTVTALRLRRGPMQRTAVLRHRFTEGGRHRLRLSVAADPVAACGRFAERAATPPIVVRT
jgi:hypothetical protein